jgi:hypothetical protein
MNQNTQNTQTKRGFLEGPKDKFANSKIVNLDQVSNVSFNEETDRFGNLIYKIIMNFGYQISLKGHNEKRIADYCYFVFEESQKEDYLKYQDHFADQINQGLWIAPKINRKINRIVNPDYVSFVAVDPGKFRVIMNLACSVSWYSNPDRMSSDFIYLDFRDHEEYKQEFNYIKDQIGSVLPVIPGSLGSPGR